MIIPLDPLLINPFTPTISISFFSSPFAIPFWKFQLEELCVKSIVFIGRCLISNHFSIRKLLVLLREITCWSLLRVKGFNDHSVFLFFKNCLTKHMQVLFSSSLTPVDILLPNFKSFGPTPDLFGIDLCEKGVRKRDTKTINDLLLPYPPPPLPPPSLDWNIISRPRESLMEITYPSGLSITDKLIFDIMLSYTSVDG